MLKFLVLYQHTVQDFIIVSTCIEICDSLHKASLLSGMVQVNDRELNFGIISTISFTHQQVVVISLFWLTFVLKFALCNDLK